MKKSTPKVKIIMKIGSKEELLRLLSIRDQGCVMVLTCVMLLIRAEGTKPEVKQGFWYVDIQDS